MSLPEKKIKQVALPGDVDGSQTYEIIPERLGKNGYEASLPNLAADNILAVLNEEQTFVGTQTVDAGSTSTSSNIPPKPSLVVKDTVRLNQWTSNTIAGAGHLNIAADVNEFSANYPNLGKAYISLNNNISADKGTITLTVRGQGEQSWLDLDPTGAYINQRKILTESSQKNRIFNLSYNDTLESIKADLIAHSSGRFPRKIYIGSEDITDDFLAGNYDGYLNDEEDYKYINPYFNTRNTYVGFYKYYQYTTVVFRSTKAADIYETETPDSLWDYYLDWVEYGESNELFNENDIIHIIEDDAPDRICEDVEHWRAITSLPEVKYFDKFVTGADIDEQMSIGQIAYCDQGSVVVGGEVPSTVIIKFTQAAKRAIYLKNIYIKYVNTEGNEVEYNYEFIARQFTSVGQTVALNGIEWQVQDPNASLYFGYSGSYGQQFGSGSQAATELTLTTVDFAGCTIKEVVITACGASSTNARLLISAGNDQWLYHEGESDEATYKVLSPNTAEDPATFTHGEGSTPGAGVIVNYVETFVKRVNTENLVEAIAPVENILYVETANNKIYRFNGSTLIEVSKSLELGGTSTTAYRGDLGSDNRNRIFDILNNQLPAKAGIDDLNAKVLSYSATMDILTSVVMPAGTSVETNNISFPAGVTVSNHNVNL